MNDKEREELEWKIQMLHEQIESLKRENHLIRRSKTIAQVLTKESDRVYKRLMVVESHNNPDGITLVVEKP